MLASNEILVKKAGLYTSIQDSGRRGFMDKGVSRSGALDKRSFCLANWLVGNEPLAPVLETTFQGLTIQFSSNCVIAVTGGDLGAKLNGVEINRYSAIAVIANDELSFAKRKSGFRSYLAVSGGIEQQNIMGSKSTHSIFDLGYGQISEDAVISFNGSSKKVDERKLSNDLIPGFTSHFTARVLPGPEIDLFSEEFTGLLSKKSFKISSDSNRMGYRLNGDLGEKKLPDGIISSGIVPGTIQVPSSGKPIILMNDGPTTGGYARIATIIAPDLDYVAQLGPGDTLRFKWIDFDEADRRLMEYQKSLTLL